jgi:hypothetical protein
VNATDADADGVYTAQIGDASVTAVRARDGCGNLSAR